MNFAFLIHSRDYTDVQRKFKIAKYLPRRWVEFWCLHWPPVVVSKINSFKKITGWLIGIPMTAKQMLENRELAKKRILQAISRAEKLGAKIVGLGALTSPTTNGGLDIVGQVETKITTGNALAVAVSFEHLKKILNQNNNIQKIAIVGGTGSIGSALSKLLVENFPDKKYLIFGRTKKNIDNLLQDLEQISRDIKVEGYFNDIENVKQTELVIVATSATKAIIKAGHLKQGAIVYDVTHPQNVAQETIKQRSDILVYDGGLIEVSDIKERLPFGLPPKVIFACFAETILLTLENYQENFSLGKTEIDKVSYINDLAKKYNFRPIKIKRVRES